MCFSAYLIFHFKKIFKSQINSHLHYDPMNYQQRDTNYFIPPQPPQLSQPQPSAMSFSSAPSQSSLRAYQPSSYSGTIVILLWIFLWFIIFIVTVSYFINLFFLWMVYKEKWKVYWKFFYLRFWFLVPQVPSMPLQSLPSVVPPMFSETFIKNSTQSQCSSSSTSNSQVVMPNSNFITPATAQNSYPVQFPMPPLSSLGISQLPPLPIPSASSYQTSNSAETQYHIMQ